MHGAASEHHEPCCSDDHGGVGDEEVPTTSTKPAGTPRIVYSRCDSCCMGGRAIYQRSLHNHMLTVALHYHVMLRTHTRVPRQNIGSSAQAEGAQYELLCMQ